MFPVGFIENKKNWICKEPCNEVPLEPDITHRAVYVKEGYMKTVRIIATIVLLICAILAAWFSYSRTLAPPDTSSPSNAGPPPGRSTPKMGGPPSGAAKSASETKGGPASTKSAEENKKSSEKGE